MAHYPADTFQEATEIAIEASNQLHGVINGDANAEVTVEDGSKIPSVRKAMVDSLYFKPPITWAQGEYEDTYNQLREFVDGDVRTWWFAKGATVSTPVLMSINPATDVNWTLWSAVTLNAATYETQKRLAAEAGLNMVGSFLLGATVTTTIDVVFYESDGKYYSWSGSFPKVVSAGSTPATSGGVGAGAWVDRTDLTLRSEISDIDGAGLIGSMSYAQLRAYSGSQTTVNVWGTSNVFDGAAGQFKVKASDTTNADNGGTILVDALERRWYRVYIGDVYPEWFGAKGDGVTDDSSSILAAASTQSALGGGRVRLCARYYIGSAITIPRNVLLEGAYMHGEQLPAATYGNYDGLASVLLISSDVTLSFSDSAGISRCLVIRYGLDLPFADAATATAGIAAFNGTAITVAGADTYFNELLVLGFNKAIYSSGFERVRLSRVLGDCTNGVDISNCADISYLNQCHFWPFTTVHQAWTTNILLRRSGYAYKFETLGDWNKVTDCFSYGYFRGFWSSSVNSMTFSGCGADNTSNSGVGDYSGAFGFVVDGTSDDTRFVNCQSSAQQVGYYIGNSGDGYNTRIVNSDSWACITSNINVAQGNVKVNGGILKNTPRGVLINNANSIVDIDSTEFWSNSIIPVDATVSTINVFVRDNCKFLGLVDGSPAVNATYIIQRSLVSADPLLLPAEGNYFQVTGNTGFGTINGHKPGRIVTLKFTGTPTLSDGGSSLKLNGNFVATADDTLTLISDGSQWFELARSSN